jgi:hypothetical protein
VCGRRLRAGLDVVAGAVHEHDEVIRIADGSPRRPALRAASGASVGGAHLPVVLPRAMQPLIKQRQGDVEDQRGEDPALRGAGVGVFVLAVLGEDARLQECLHQRSTRLSFTLARTASITARWETLSKAASISASSTQRWPRVPNRWSSAIASCARRIGRNP